MVVYAYLRTVKAVGTRRYIESYAKPSQYIPGIRAFLRTERTAVKWSVFTGVCLGALALAWQGYTYGVVVIGVGVLIAMLVERIRKVDSFGLYCSTWIVGLVAFPMAAPYYFVQGDLPLFFDVPILLFFGTLAILLPFLLMRDIPWVFSIPALILFVGGAAILLKVVFPRYFTDVITGQGYFVKNLVYSTIAEAQAPSIDSLVIGYGVITFFLAFAGVALFVYLLARHRFKRYHLVFLVFAMVSIYLPISASKFFFIGSPVFALLPPKRSIARSTSAGYPALRRKVARSPTGGAACRVPRAFKAEPRPRPGAGPRDLPPEHLVRDRRGDPLQHQDRDRRPRSRTPSLLAAARASEPVGQLLRGRGNVPRHPEPVPIGRVQLARAQDINVPEPQRPAFVSWWDYGFQAIAQGTIRASPTTSRTGSTPRGSSSSPRTNRSRSRSWPPPSCRRSRQASGLPGPSGRPQPILARDGSTSRSCTTTWSTRARTTRWSSATPRGTSRSTRARSPTDNTMYLATSYFLAGSLPLTAVARVYNDIQAYTGWSIRYAMADSRLFPFSGSDTGIYYAPADLTGRVINNAGLPSTFFNVSVLGSDGNTYPLGSVPANVAPVQYQINYQAPFYNSMIYRTYIGYNGTDTGLSAGFRASPAPPSPLRSSRAGCSSTSRSFTRRRTSARDQEREHGGGVLHRHEQAGGRHDRERDKRHRR